MNIKVGVILKDFDGADILQTDGRTPWSMGLVLLTAALAGPAPGTNYSEEEQIKRYLIAADIRDALRSFGDGMLDSVVDLTPQVALMLKGSVVRNFGPIVAGQMIPILNDQQPQFVRRRGRSIEVVEAERPD